MSEVPSLLTALTTPTLPHPKFRVQGFRVEQGDGLLPYLPARVLAFERETTGYEPLHASRFTTQSWLSESFVFFFFTTLKPRIECYKSV